MGKTAHKIIYSHFLPSQRSCVVLYFALSLSGHLKRYLGYPGIKFKKYLLIKVCIYSSKIKWIQDEYQNFLLSSFSYFFQTMSQFVYKGYGVHKLYLRYIPWTWEESRGKVVIASWRKLSLF